MMRPTRALLLSLLAAMLAAAPAAAQTVRGTLREPGGAPVERVLVALVDASGRQVARTLTDASGAFTLRAPGAGRYSVRAERIGYTATTSPSFALADGETRTQPLVAAGVAVTLQGITVSPAARRCAVRPGAGLATATLWEEARKALNATAFGQSARLFRYDVAEWTRELDPDAGTVRREERRSSGGMAQLPFRSLPATELSEKGYVQPMRGDSLGYWGPDAEVMLSDEFLADHCLRVVEGDDPALVGLAFEPVRNRRVPDIRGTLWLDRRSSELRRVDYRYQGGPRESDNPRIGGTVEYERLPGGPWIVRRWNIRMPQVKLEQQLRSIRLEGASSTPATINRTTTQLTGVLEAGGEVTGVATREGRPVFAAEAAPVIRGTVWDSIRAAPLAGAHVYLSGTQASAETGPDGGFTLRAPGDGRYTVAFTHPELGPLASAARPQTVNLKPGDTATVALAVRGWAAATASLCADTALRREPGVVYGRVTGPGAADATVTGSWFATGYTRPSFAFARTSVAARTDPQGFYVLCGVSTQALVTVRAQTPEARGEETVRSSGGAPARADVAMAAVTAAERMAGVTERALQPAGSASRGALSTFTVVARDVSGQPLPGATLRIGPRAAVLTDSAGRARIAALPPGSYPMEMTHPTAGTLTGRVTLTANEAEMEVRAGNRHLEVTSQWTVALAGVEARAQPRAAGLDIQGFYARRERGHGVFLTDSAIQVSTSGRLLDVLRRVQGIRVMRYTPPGQGRSGSDTEEQYRVASGRGSTGISMADFCWMDVYVDGVLVQSHDRSESAQNLAQIRVRDVQAVEAYRGAAEVPAEFRGGSSSCGVVLVWTRR